MSSGAARACAPGTSTSPSPSAACGTHPDVSSGTAQVPASLMCGASKGQDHTWADMQSDEEGDSSEQRSTDARDSGKGDDDVTMPSLTNALTHSLLIQSFNATSRANSVMTSTEHLSPENSESPSTVVWQPHTTTVGFNALSTVPEAGAPVPAPAAPPSIKVSVPIAAASGRTHGYAGLLGAFGSTEQSAERAPCLSAVGETQDAQVMGVLKCAQAGIALGRVPEAALDGMGGTYFLCSDTGSRVAIFKPCDEEPLAPNNPKQWQGRAMGMPGMKPSVRVGEAALREVAAYLLDHDAFAGVPAACLAKCYHPALNYRVQVPRIESLMNVAAPPHAAQVTTAEPHNFAAAPAAALMSAAESALLPAPCSSEADAGAGGLSRVFCRKTPPLQPEPAPVVPSAPGSRKLGSLQRFVPSKCDANDMSPSFFSADNVHRIGLLDLRLFNCDRHTGNLLVQEGARSSAAADTAESFPRHAPYTIVPIDHGYALPEALDNPYFEWLFWPQTSVPFSEAVKAYVAGLDAAADVAKLRAALPQLREECFRCLETTTIVLQLCVAAGLTLFEIGSIFTRPEGCSNGQMPSDLEALCMDAREEAVNTVSEHDSSSGNTSPSQPGSPVSFGFNVHSANTLPAVEEGDSDEDSGCLFNLSAGGEYPRSPRQNVQAPEQAETSELSPLMFPMTPRDVVSGGSGALAGDSAQRPADVCDIAPAVQLGANARFCSLPFATPAYLRNGNMSSDGDTTPTPAPAQSASGVAMSQAPARWGRRGLPRARRNAWRSKHGAQRNMPAYPALLPGTHPDQVNYVFSDLSDAQWKVFVQKLEEYVHCELASNTWKTQRMTGCMAGSCPVAFTRHMQ